MSTQNLNQQLAVTVDSVLFTVINKQLHVLMIKRAVEPFAGKWTVVGGAFDTDLDDNTDMAAKRKLKIKSGLTINYLEQLKTYSGTWDPRGFTVSVTYFALTTPDKVKPDTRMVEETRWVPVDELEVTQIGFHHREVIEDALLRLREKAKYTLIPLYCLPKEFTVAEFVSVMQSIIGKPVQRKSIQRRLDKIEALREVKGDESAIKRTGPVAKLYTLDGNIGDILFERNME